MLFVLERLLERAWSGDAADTASKSLAAERAVARTFHRTVYAVLPLIAVIAFARIWVGALGLSVAASGHALRAINRAAAMLCVAYAAWAAGRLAIERHIGALSPNLRVPVERDHGFRWKMITQSGGT